MQAQLGHIQINVMSQNLDFYKTLFTFLEWRILFHDETMLAVEGTEGCSLWFSAGADTRQNDYDGVGMNHLGFHVSSQAQVDDSVRFLKQNEVELLFETPRHRPEFSSSEDHTYYQVMFELPDRILFEIVFIGEKAEKSSGLA